MSRTTTLLLSAALLLTLVPDDVAAQPTGVEYVLLVECPGPSGRNSGRECPVRAVDADDQMGDPSLAVDPLQPDNLIMASLHGTSDCGGPTVKSRCRQVFTTFTSEDSGERWSDQPYYPPSQVGGGAFGQHPQVTIDPYGRVYVGSLYATAVGDREDRQFEYVLAAQKFSSLHNIESEQDGEYNSEYLDPVYQGNAIGQMWFLFNPRTDNMTMVWHENVTDISTTALGRDNNDCVPPEPASSPPPPPPTSTSSTSSSASPTSSSTSTTASSTGTTTPSLNPSAGTLRLPLQQGARPVAIASSDSTAAASLQQAAANASDGPHSVIGVVWTGSSLQSCYQYQPHEWVIGPCLKSTNPVLSEGWLYVGCMASTQEGEFRYNNQTVHGQIEMFRMNPDGGEPQYIGATPIHGGSPKLGVRSDGRLALANANVSADGRLEVAVSFGKYNPSTSIIDWTSTRGYGNDIEKVSPSVLLVDATIQDLIFREHSGVIHFILKTRFETVGTVIVGQVTDALQANIRKTIIAISEDYGVLAKLPMNIGALENRTDTILIQANEDAYNDLSDDYLQLPMQLAYEYVDDVGKTHILDYYQREFVAVADYGTVMFAEIVELTNLRGPAVPNPAQPVPAQPAPAASTNAVNAAVPAAGLTMAGALALALLSTKRKEAAIVRARKRRDP